MVLVEAGVWGKQAVWHTVILRPKTLEVLTCSTQTYAFTVVYDYPATEQREWRRQTFFLTI